MLIHKFLSTKIVSSYVYEAQTLLGLGVSRCWTCRVRHWHI